MLLSTTSPIAPQEKTVNSPATFEVGQPCEQTWSPPSALSELRLPSRPWPCWSWRWASAPAPPSSPSSTPWSSAGCRSTSTTGWWPWARRRPPPIERDPARDPQQLVTASPQDFMDWDQRQQVFESLAATTDVVRDAPRARRRAGRPARAPRDRRHLRRAAHRPRHRPAVHGGERGGGPSPRRGAERRALAPPLRLGPVDRRPHHPAGRRGLRGAGRDAPRRHLPGGRGSIHRPLHPVRRARRRAHPQTRRPELLPAGGRPPEAGHDDGSRRRRRWSRLAPR